MCFVLFSFDYFKLWFSINLFLDNEASLIKYEKREKKNTTQQWFLLLVAERERSVPFTVIKTFQYFTVLIYFYNI